MNNGIVNFTLIEDMVDRNLNSSTIPFQLYFFYTRNLSRVAMKLLEDEDTPNIKFSKGNLTIMQYSYKLDRTYRVQLELDSLSEFRGKSVEVSAWVPEEASFLNTTDNRHFKINNQTINLAIEVPHYSSRQAESAKGVASTTGNTLDKAAKGMEIVSAIGMFFSLDPSGSSIKFAMQCKLVSRFSLINIHYGSILGMFLNQLAMKFAQASEEDKEFVIRSENGWKGRLSQAHISVSVIKTLGWKVYFYILSWIAKIWSIALIARNRVREKALPTFTSFIYYHKKAHFIISTIVMIDGALIATRGCIHSKGEITLDYIIAHILVALMTLDILYYTSDMPKSTSLKGNTSITTRYKNFRELVSIRCKENSMDSSTQNLNQSINQSSTLPKKVPLSWLSPEEASQLGYQQKYDIDRQCRIIREDDGLANLSSSVKTPQSPDFVLFNNTDKIEVVFIYRIVLYQIIIVGLPQLPILEIGLIIALEAYFGVVSIALAKEGYFKSKLMMAKRVADFSFLFLFLLYLLTVYGTYTWNPKQDVSQLLQQLGFVFVLVGFFIEVIFLLLKIIMFVVFKYQDRSKKEGEEKIGVQFTISMYYWSISPRTPENSIRDDKKDEPNKLNFKKEKVNKKTPNSSLRRRNRVEGRVKRIWGHNNLSIAPVEEAFAKAKNAKFTEIYVDIDTIPGFNNFDHQDHDSENENKKEDIKGD